MHCMLHLRSVYAERREFESPTEIPCPRMEEDFQSRRQEEDPLSISPFEMLLADVIKLFSIY